MTKQFPIAPFIDDFPSITEQFEKYTNERSRSTSSQYEKFNPETDKIGVIHIPTGTAWTYPLFFNATSRNFNIEKPELTPVIEDAFDFIADKPLAEPWVSVEEFDGNDTYNEFDKGRVVDENMMANFSFDVYNPKNHFEAQRIVETMNSSPFAPILDSDQIKALAKYLTIGVDPASIWEIATLSDTLNADGMSLLANGLLNGLSFEDAKFSVTGTEIRDFSSIEGQDKIYEIQDEIKHQLNYGVNPENIRKNIQAFAKEGLSADQIHIIRIYSDNLFLTPEQTAMVADANLSAADLRVALEGVQDAFIDGIDIDSALQDKIVNKEAINRPQGRTPTQDLLHQADKAACAQDIHSLNQSASSRSTEFNK